MFWKCIRVCGSRSVKVATASRSYQLRHAQVRGPKANDLRMREFRSSLRRHGRLACVKHTNPAVTEVGEPNSALRIHSEETDHLCPRRERIFSEFSCSWIEPGDIGAEIVPNPQITGLFVYYNPVDRHIFRGRLVVGKFLVVWIELAKSVVRNVSKPNILLRIHLDSSHGLHVGNRIYLYGAGLRVNPEKTRFIVAAGSPGVVMSVQRDVIGIRRPKYGEFLRMRIESRDIARSPDIAMRVLSNCVYASLFGYRVLGELTCLRVY